MRLKFKESLIGLLFVVIGLSIYGCIDEEPIEPIKRPFSEIRIVNLSSNVDNMRVLVDDKQVGTLPITGATGYFDVNSGDRNFKIFNQSGDKVFDKTLTIISYDRLTLAFTGFYSADPLLSTFQNFEVVESEVLVSSAPEAGKLNVYIVHASSSVDTIEAKKFTMAATIIPVGGTPKDTTYKVSSTSQTNAVLEFTKSYSIGNAVPGDYIFRFTAGSTTVTTDSLNLTAGMRYYLFIYGHPNNVQVFNNPVVPQPIRNK